MGLLARFARYTKVSDAGLKRFFPDLVNLDEVWRLVWLEPLLSTPDRWEMRPVRNACTRIPDDVLVRRTFRALGAVSIRHFFVFYENRES